MKDYSYVFNAHPEFIDNIYKAFKEDRNSVEEGWRVFFDGFEFNGNASIGTSTASNGAIVAPGNMQKEFGVMSIIHGFRSRGHLLSTTNPIRQRRDRKPHLDLEDYKLSKADLEGSFNSGAEIGMGSNAKLKDIISKLETIYCGNIGFEYAHIENREKRMWLRDKIENRDLSNDYGHPVEKKKRILRKINGAVVFEKFLHTKYIGQKRFSLEGGESTIAALDAIINKGAADSVQEVVIGMAHRGRLNVLANIMGKTYEHIFNEFEGVMPNDLSFGDGDVKYHLGFSSLVETPTGKVHLKLAPNPSHLEAVNTVVEGYSRAKADMLYNSDYDKILPILIHGDAAIAGQGIIYETVQMSQLDGYYTGGTIHFVINNQVGFTTDFDDARSSTYCTGVASLVQAPVFHVNGDDPDAVVFAAELATEYRQKFNNDVFIDMVCYRKHGHNEGDDPKFTQPEMYKYIKDHKDPRVIYHEKLVAEGEAGKELSEQLEKEFWAVLQDRLDSAKEKTDEYKLQEPEVEWSKMKMPTTEEDFLESPETAIDEKTRDKLLQHLVDFPKGMTPLSKMKRLQKSKLKMLEADKLDWAFGELMAYGSILMENKDVRMSGQDVKRGTFSHRHVILNDAENYKQYNLLDNITDKQGKFHIYNSLLSEFGVMGFEYGYAMAAPNSLVIWEAQFGDFYNGAQTMVDQFLSAGESKWQRLNGLVLLLPHGQEGQGPEHSSARMERWLQLCAETNMVVCNLTTPANIFHALRRQLAWDFRKPLIIMSPKSLLRHPKAVSSRAEFVGDSKFQEYIDDPVAKASAKRLLLCTGKIYYDLLAKKEEEGLDDVAIVRVEQLFPLPKKGLEKIFKKYKNAKKFWVQEEPENMGAWTYLMRYWRNEDIEVFARKASASPATGFKYIYEQVQAKLVSDALGLKS